MARYNEAELDAYYAAHEEAVRVVREACLAVVARPDRLTLTRTSCDHDIIEIIADDEDVARLSASLPVLRGVVKAMMAPAAQAMAGNSLFATSVRLASIVPSYP